MKRSHTLPVRSLLTELFVSISLLISLHGSAQLVGSSLKERGFRGQVKSLEEFAWTTTDAVQFMKDSLNGLPDKIAGNIASFLISNMESREIFNRMILREALLFDENGNILEERKRVYRSGAEIPVYTRVTHQYDEKGNKTESDFYDENGNLTTRFIIKYEKGGRKSEYIRRYRMYDQPVQSPQDLFVATYDSLGNSLERRYYGWSDKKQPVVMEVYKSSYKYDSFGNILEDNTVKSADGSLSIMKYTYKRDDRGNVMEKCVYDSGGKIINKTTFKRDDKGNLLELNEYDPGGITYKKTYKWDDRGNQIAWETTGDIEQLVTSDAMLKATLTYEYDRQGNWIRRITASGGRVSSYSRREIEYFE